MTQEKKKMEEIKTYYVDDQGNTVWEIKLPGYKREEITLTVEEDYLQLVAKREKNDDSNNGRRTVRETTIEKWVLTPAHSKGGITAKFEDGLLTIIIKPKKTAKTNIKIL